MTALEDNTSQEIEVAVENDYTFVHYTPNKRDGSLSNTNAGRKNSRGQTVSRRRPELSYVVQKDRKSIQLSLESTATAVDATKRCRRKKSAVADPTFTPMTALVWSEQLLGLFLSDNVDALRTPNDSSLQFLAWFRRLPSLSVQHEVAGLSARALVLVAVGRANDDDRLMHHASSVYADALSQLSGTLRHRSQAKRAESVITCFIFVAYGLYMSESIDFRAHVMGLSSLMQQLGPDAFKDGELRQMYLACRQYLTFAFLTFRVRSFLAEEAWLRIIPEEAKSAYERLLDSVVHLPTLRANFLATKEAPSGSARRRTCRHVLDQAWLLRASVLYWHATLAPNISSSDPVPGFEIDSTDAFHCPPQQHFRFVSTGDAGMIQVYWTSLVEIYNISSQCYDALGLTGSNYTVPTALAEYMPLGMIDTHPVPGSNSLPDFDLTQPIRPFAAAEKCKASGLLYAKAICSSFDYITSNRPTAFSLFHYMGPLKQACRCFVLNLPASAEYLLWTHEAIRSLQTYGCHIADAFMADGGVY